MLTALVLALGVVGASVGWAHASTPDARADKKKATKVEVVVEDTHMEGMAEEEEEEEEEEHLPGTMSMVVTPDSVRHGRVKFAVENAGSEVHELVVLKTNTAFDQLAVNADDEVNEAAAVGEVESIAAGKTKSKAFKLSAGEYVLVCNIAGHYGAGMRAAFTVT